VASERQCACFVQRLPLAALNWAHLVAWWRSIARANRRINLNPGNIMPEQKTVQRARRDAAQGKSPSTQAGEFVREQIHHIREGKHGARSTKQAIAIGLSEARRSGVPLAPPKEGGNMKRKAGQDLAAGRRKHRTSAKRSRAAIKALKKEGRSAASHRALSRQARQAARKRGPRARSQAGKKAAATRGRGGT